jgi:phospholipid/cholesterol/gamma-HCH transport system substrate-binding protein
LLRDSLTQVSTLRAYSPELTGWFDDFGHSGFPDAFGGIGRISTTLNTFTVGPPSSGIPCTDPFDILTDVCQALSPSDLFSELMPGIKFLRRCPGSNERGLTEEQLTQGGTIDCDPSQTPLGP